MKHVALLGTLLLASAATACTAIVAGKLSDTSDYGTSANPTTAGDDPCSLLYVGYKTLADANDCSKCITNNCSAEVGYFCTDEKPVMYYESLQNCAQNPYNGRAPGQTGSFASYECSDFAATIPTPNDPASESAHESNAHNCITTKCLSGDAPSCRLCAVSIQKPGSGNEVSALETDLCGSCVATQCKAALSECCSTAPVTDFIQYCAYTLLPENKTNCLALANPDAGSMDISNYDDAGAQCLTKLQSCFSSCVSTCQKVQTGTQ